jgi:TonB family protein
LTQAIEGSVYVRYVVDTLGRADVTTAVVLASDHPSFTQAVLEALPGMRFRPATISSRRVRQLVEQEFTFRITPPSMASSHGTP